MKNLCLVYGIAVYLICAVLQAQTKDANITHEEARQRAEGISNLTYDLLFRLDEKSASFFGRAEIKFELAKTKKLFVDFKYGKVKELRINGKERDIKYDGFRLYLPESAIQKGINTVFVTFEQNYSKNGTGLYRFIDPLDKSVYVYSMFEPFDAHHMFPCFDQPDLKAKFHLKVEAPKDWTVISTTTEKSVQSVDAIKRWDFDQTPLLSTYVVSLHAGPYKVWTSKYKDIPLRLFARKTLATQVKAEEWFGPLKHGLAVYEKMFDYPYPFKKYDQIVVPDFNFGAMENVGAVTFSERYLRSGQKTKEELEGLANTILHELAHMWFGDLVTMRWWNGLWLNESFANYISYVAMSESKQYPNVWVDFAMSEKVWAYTEDELVTTHPIELEVPDTLNAFTNFDGITYGKGGSVLKQLHFYLGDEKFRKGLQRYFKTHQYSNTEISDFLGAMATESGLDLKTWSQLWLEEAGLDSVKVEFTCYHDKYKSFELVQKSAPGSSRFRPHRTMVGLYDLRNEKMVLRKKVSVSYQGERTSVPEMMDQDCAALVYPNTDDNDYVKVELDSESLKGLASFINKIEDPLIRGLVWQSLNQMLRDQNFKLSEFSEMAIQSLKTERHPLVIGRILTALLGHGKLGYQSAREYWPKSTEAEIQKKNSWINELESILWNRLQKSPAGSDDQKLWLDGYIKTVESKSGTTRLASLLEKKTLLKGFTFDQDRRWDLIVKLAQLDHAKAPQYIEFEEKLDPSDKGQKQALSAKAAIPKADQKLQLFNEIVNNKDMPLARAKSVMKNLNPHTEVAFKKILNDQFYEKLLSVIKDRDQEYLGDFVENLAPRTCEKTSIDKLGRFISEKGAQLTPVVSRPLRVVLQEETRCLKIREFSASDSTLQRK